MAEEHDTTNIWIRLILFPTSLMHPAIALAIPAGRYFIHLEDYLLFHGIAKPAGIAFALSLFIIIWNIRMRIPDAFFPAAGISFFFIDCVNLVLVSEPEGKGKGMMFRFPLPGMPKKRDDTP